MQPGDQHPTDVLRCLTMQLACQTRNFVSVSRVLHHRLIHQQAPPTLEKLSRALIDTAKQFDRVFLVLHGLGEHEPESDLLPFFRTIATANIGVFLTHGPSGLDSRYSFLAPVNIDLAARAKDIETYIRFRIQQCPNGKHLLRRPADVKKFVTDLTACANELYVIRDTYYLNGKRLTDNTRFLYVHLVIPSLLQQPTTPHIFLELQKLHAALPDNDPHTTMYTLAIARIRALPPAHTALAVKILLWVSKATHPLPLSALREAIAITDATPGVLDSSDTPTMLAVCEGLITVDATSGTVRLVNPSTADYIHPIIPEDANYRVVHACISYLSHGLFAAPASPTSPPGHRSVEERLQTFPFYAYATKHLAHHIAACEPASTTQLLLAFVRREGAIQSYFQAKGQVFREPGSASLSLRMAIDVGHLPVVLRLLEDGIDPFVPDESGHTALRWAVAATRLEIVDVLEHWRKFVRVSNYELEMREVWSPDVHGRSVLHVAARRGILRLVDAFLPFVDLDDTVSGCSTPLHEAVHGGHNDVVELILKQGVDPTVIDEDGRTALHVAAAQGHLAIIVQLFECRNFRSQGDGRLIERLDVGMKDRIGITPLHLAALGGHRDVLQYLLNQGASWAIRDNAGERALFKAARGGDALSVRMLLESQPTPKSRNVKEIGAIEQAATRGYTDIITVLLQYSSNQLLQAYPSSALELALAGGYEDAVQVLRSSGAEPPLPLNVTALLVEPAKAGDTRLVQLLLSHGGNPSGKPLMAAAAAGRKNTTKLLLAAGADIAVQDELGWTALHHAANAGHVLIVRLLAGQSTAARNLQDQTAMVLAAGNGHEAVVRALLPDLHDGEAMTEDIHPAFFLAARNGHHRVATLLAIRGATVHTVGKDGRTAFIIAVEDGHSKVVELLLRFGADTSETTTSGESALFVATRNGSVEIVRMLLENGADISATNAEGQTALFVAGKHNHPDVYALLVEKGVNQFVRDRAGKMAALDGDGDADDGGYLPVLVG